MLKIVHCDSSLFYHCYPELDKQLFYMDPQIGWFQPEQCGPALSLWTEIWNSHQRLGNTEVNSKHDNKNSDLLVGNGIAAFSSDDRKPPIKKSDTNSSENSSFNNRVKRKDNKASTYGLIRNEELIKGGLTPWRFRKFYNPGLVGYVVNFCSQIILILTR